MAKGKSQSRKNKKQKQGSGKSRLTAEQVDNRSAASALSKWLMPIALTCLVVVAGIGWTLWSGQKDYDNLGQPAKTEVSQSTSKEVAPEGQIASYRQGGAYWCRGIPPFVHQLDLKQPVAIDTRQSRVPGVVIRELKGGGSFRHPSWSVTGSVGPTVMDRDGNVYVISVPSVSLDTNPVARNQIVYKIDGQTGVMEDYLALPATDTENYQHPFGTMSLGMDCDTNSLYVSSVSGSTPRAEKGVIYKIDLNLRKVTDVYRDTDAIGVGVFNFKHEKRLYYGSARNSHVFSIGLNEKGKFQDDNPRYEFSLSTLKDGDTTSAKKFRFSRGNSGRFTMAVDETEFGYRLTAESVRAYKRYIFSLDEATGRWEYTDLARGG